MLVKVEGLIKYDYFKVIDIVDNTNLYSTLLRIDWVIKKHTVINFKKIILSFEDCDLRVVALIDPLDGQRYIDPINSEGKGNYIDHI